MTSEPNWPPVTYETLPWVGTLSPGAASRRALAAHRGSYEAAITPPIAGAPINLPSDILAAAEDASNEISRFDAELGSELGPFGAVLLRSESAASSQIENLTASARAIAEAELGDNGRQNAALIVANSSAMQAAVDLADRLDSDSILLMHRALLHHSQPQIAGRWRTEQVWIGGSNLGPHRAVFVPPHHGRVAAAIDDLIAFIARDDLPVLVQSAVAHAQFETIHPFPDGNGRTGRALLHAMLRSKSLTRNVTVPVSAGLLVDTGKYFDALGAYRTGDLGAMVSQLAQASFAALTNGRLLVDELRQIRRSWADEITARRDSAVWRIADLLIRRPVINSVVLQHELGIAPNNAPRYIDVLVRAEVLVEFTDQKRNRAWRSTEVLQALDDFAIRAGRRRLS